MDLAGVVLFVLVCAASDPSHAMEGDIEALKLGTDVSQANLEQLRTWQGLAVVEDRQAGEGQPSWRAQGTIEFVLDRDRKATRWNSTWRNGTVGDEAKRQGLCEEISRGIVIEDAFYYLHVPKQSPKEQYTALVLPLTQIEHATRRTQHFQPLDFFAATGLTPAKSFQFYYDNRDAATKGAVQRLVKRQQNLIVMELKDSQGHERFEADLNVGANWTRIENENAREGSSELFAIGYEKAGDVWVPKSYSYKHRELRDAKIVNEWAREVRWTKNVVNASIDQIEFSLPKLGLRQGDIIRDTRTKSETVVSGSEFPVPRSK